MKTCISFLTKDRLALTKQTIRPLLGIEHDLLWIDGSSDEDALAYFDEHRYDATESRPAVKGGADRAIVYALTTMLHHPAEYDYVGLCESDVLLPDDWFAKTMQLFSTAAADGLCVGAVSARAYEDRILIQRDGYAVMLNLGAGHVVFARRAAELVLANYRTGWWSDTRAVFAQLSGIDIGRFAAFRGNEQWNSVDWCWDAVLAQHGFVSVAATPTEVEMVGQEPPLEDQGLTLAREPVRDRRDGAAFDLLVQRSAAIRDGLWQPTTIKPVHEHMGVHTHFAHLLDAKFGFDEWRCQWSAGFGGFAYRSNSKFSTIHLMVYGPCTFLVSGGKTGAKIRITDTETGYEVNPDLPAGEMQIAQLPVPGNVVYREIVLTCDEGAVFYGIQTTQPQPTTNHKFDFNSLPPV